MEISTAGITMKADTVMVPVQPCLQTMGTVAVIMVDIANKKHENQKEGNCQDPLPFLIYRIPVFFAPWTVT